ncbi:hypothetical protein [Lysinibacillus sp. NPDC056232]|uniref:hypothetical protein n=1 Tax=Lysinibacillus sp. NPDC056232 TaxID=3345756 RepID=UPI0035D643B0
MTDNDEGIVQPNDNDNDNNSLKSNTEDDHEPSITLEDETTSLNDEVLTSTSFFIKLH